MAKPRGPKKSNGDIAVPVAPSATPVAAAAVETPPEVPAAKLTRKPVIVKSETRANLVPINVEEEIRRLAYLLAERRGFEPGHETEDWLAAEHEVSQRYHQHSA